MQAFVTGATGLLGNNLVRVLLAGGHAVRALVRSAAKGRRLLGDTDAVLVGGDVTDARTFAAELEGCDVVFHTAAYFRETFRAGRHGPQADETNVRATLALVETARERGVQRFVDTSTMGVVGRKPDGSPGDETTEPPPLARSSPYLRSKVAAAAALRAFAARPGVDIVQVLPGWMFGPWDDAPSPGGRLVKDFLARRLTGIPPGGINVVDARDVAAGMIAAAERGRSGERYLLGGPYLTLGEILAALERATGLPAPRARIPYAFAWLYAAFAELRARVSRHEPPLTRAAAKHLRARLHVTSEKAARELGWSWRPVEETLRDAAAWLRAPSARLALVPA